MTRAVAFLVAVVLVVAVLAVTHRRDKPDAVTVVASREVTEQTGWPVERPPDLGEGFGRLVAASRPKAKARTGPITGPRGLFPTDDLLHALAMCESHMNQRAVSNTRPPYYSFFQWHLPTWWSIGGQGDPRDVPYEVQAPLARALIMRSGWSQFPVCSRVIGAR